MRLSNIALYDKNTTDFFDQGLGILSDAISSESTEEVQDNGNITYEMVLKYPIGGVLSDQLKLPNLIRAQESEDPNDFMIFEIYDYDEDDEGAMTVYAQAMPYRVLRLPFNDDSKFPTKYKNIQELMDYAVSRVTGFPSWFKITSDIIVANNLSFDSGNAQFENLGKFLDATLSLIDASVEYKWNRINILDSRGRDLSDIVLRDDKNTNGIKITGSYEKIINKVVPIIRNRNETTGEFEDGTHMGSVVTSKDPFKWIPYYAGVTATFDSQEEANNYISSNKLDNPAITVDVTPLMVDEDLTQVHTFDRITAYSTKLKYQDTLQVTTRVFDQLNAEVVSFKMGSIKKDINSTTSYTLSSLASEIARAQNIAGGAARSADGKNKVYFPGSNPTDPSEGDLWFHKIDGKDVGEQYINGEWVTIIKDSMGEEIRYYVDQKMLENNDAMNKLHSDLESNSQTIKDNKQAVDDAMSKVNEDLTKAKSDAASAVQKADGAVGNAQSAVNASGLATTTANSANDAALAAKNLATQVSSDFDSVRSQAATAANDSANALSKAKDAMGQSTTAIDNASDALTQAKSALATASSVKTSMQPTITAAVDKVKGELTASIQTVQNGLDSLNYLGRNLAIRTSSQISKTLGQTINPLYQLSEDLAGKTITIALDIKGDSIGNTWKIATYGTWFGLINGTIDGTIQHVVATITIPAANHDTAIYWQDGSYATGGGTTNLVISNLIIAEGTREVPWVIAPEDDASLAKTVVDNTTKITANSKEIALAAKQSVVDTLSQQVTDNTSQLKLTATAASLEVTSKKVDTLSQTVTDQGAKLDLTATSAQLKVTENKVDALNKTVSDNSAQLKLTATSAALETQSKRVDTISGQVDTNTADITAANGAIELKANNSRVDTLSNTVKQQGIDLKAAQGELKLKLTQSDLTQGLNGYATQTWAQNQITATADGLEANLSTLKANVDNMQIGGRNLHIASTEADGYWADKGGLAGIGNANDSRAGDFISITPTNDYILQYWLDGAVASEIKGWIGHTFWDKDKKFISYHSYGVGVSDYKLITFSGGIPSNAAYIKVSYYRQKGKGRVKFEEGTLATDWSPAPEDQSAYTDTKIANLKLTVDGLSGTFAKQTDLESTNSNLKVTSDGLNLITAVTGTKGENVTQVIADVNNIKTMMTGPNGYTTRLQTLEGFQQTATNSISGLQSAQTQLSDTLVTTVGTTNLIMNSEAASDLSYWTDTNKSGWYRTSLAASMYNQTTNSFGISRKGLTAKTYAFLYSEMVPVSPGTPITAGAKMRIINDIAMPNDFDYAGIGVRFYDKNKAKIADGVKTKNATGAYLGEPWFQMKIENFVAPYTAAYVSLYFQSAGNGHIFFAQPQLSKSTTLPIYTPGSLDAAQLTIMQGLIDARVTVDGKIAAALNLSADGGGTVTIRGASLYVTAASHFDNASIQSAAIASLDAKKITSGSISSDRLATTKLNADNITSGSIAAERLATTKLNADNITSGSINADLITTGTLSADRIWGGTLNGYLMNIVNINANNITTGTISGANLAINLTTGEVMFQKGSIKSSNGRLNIDVNDGTFTQSDGTKGMMFAQGNLYLSSSSWWEGLSNPDAAPKPDYGFIGYTDTLMSSRGFGVIGRDALTLGLTDNDNTGMKYTSPPVITMDRSNVKLDFAGELATIQAGKEFTITTNTIYNSPQIPGIEIGTTYNRSGLGDRVFIDGSYVYIPSAYSRTASGSANLIVASDGALVRTSSASKYKSDIARFRSTEMAEKLIRLPQAHWYNKEDMKRYSEDPDHYSMPKMDYGMIAEDIAGAGLEDLVSRGEDGELEDVRYDRMAAVLLPLIASMKQEIEELKGE